MPERLPAPGPQPPGRPPEPHGPVDEDEPVDLPDLDDLDALDDAEDDLELFEDVPDDEPLHELFDEAPAPDPLEPLDLVDDVPDDEELVFDEATEAEPEVDASEPVILPWQTVARIVEQVTAAELDVQAVLEPGRAVTLWQGGAPGQVRIVLGEVSVVVRPEIAEGEPLLRVGRDVLAGRILVES